MTDISKICNLTVEDRQARLRELRTKLLPLARGKQELPDGIALFFDAGASLRSELDAFVDFERQCCPGLGFSVQDAPGELRLEITGIDPSASVFADIGIAHTAHRAASAQREPSDWLRLVRSAGLGAIGAFVLFCLIPIGLVAALGAQFAGPLAGLDDPWIIGAGTLLFAAILWRWERRREAVRR
jgi:hypothetical protein